MSSPTASAEQDTLAPPDHSTSSASTIEKEVEKLQARYKELEEELAGKVTPSSTAQQHDGDDDASSATIPISQDNTVPTTATSGHVMSAFV